jgi:hypothetical protein
MNTSKTSIASFDNKVSILSRVNKVIDKISYGDEKDTLIRP